VNERLLQTLVTVAFGAIAGGVTNAVAVWMLFHPYRAPRLFGREIRFLQGAIPKNQGRLARAMGRTVGTKLLTPEDLARTLAEPGFRQAFDERLAAFLRSVFQERRGALTELLPPGVTAELRQVLLEAAERGLLRLNGYLESEEFQLAVANWVDVLAAELRERPLSELITPEREEGWITAADGWLAEVTGSDSFQRAIADYVDRLAERLLQPDRTFQQLLPAGLVAAVERAIAGYLPIALERLGGMLDDPAARSHVERVLHELLDRFMRDLRFHQRLVAALLITPDTIDRVIRAIEAEGAAKISELLQDPDVRDAMARGVNSAIVDFLEKPVVGVLGTADEPSVAGAKETVTGWLGSVARDPATRGFLVDRLRGALARAEERTWGELFDRLPPDRIARAVVSAARSERAATLYRDLAERAVEWVLNRPIGRLADHISEEAPARVERTLGPALWLWLQEQVPSVAQRIDIVARVEAKILEFPTAQVEALIRGVTEKELQLIVRLGYVLGAGIGLASAGVSMLF
jgi:uncharacterized membrane protein YheB (UPF0754 family)